MLIRDIPQLILRNIYTILSSVDNNDIIYKILLDNAPYFVKEYDEYSCTDYVLHDVGNYLYEGYWYCFSRVPTSDVISLLRLIKEARPVDYSSFLSNDDKYITNITLLKGWDELIKKVMNELKTNEPLALFNSTDVADGGSDVNFRKEIEDVLRRNPKGMHVNEISQIISENLALAASEVLKKVQNICAADAKKKSSDITRVLNPKTNKPRKGWYRFVVRKGNVVKIDPTTPLAAAPINMPVASKMSTTFEGKAGECAVMSELLWRGYNVNTFLVDDGVDVVASKNNMFYLLQVKTTQLGANNRVSIALNEARFESFIGFNICYVIVVRSRVNNIDANLFFIFNNKDIARFINQKRIKKPNGNSINVKIKFINNIPYIYDEEDEDLSTFYLNNWNNL